MTDEEILAEFRAAEALLDGHFILSSGLRSPRYLQCARVLMDPARAERLARALADKIPADVRNQVGAVVSPAMGGVIIGHEMGRALGLPAMFVERPTGTFELRVRKDLHWKLPRAETATHLITFGLDADLDDAARQALRQMIDWIAALTGISRDEAYSLSSFAVDLRVTQTVNNVKGVHAMLERSILRPA